MRLLRHSLHLGLLLSVTALSVRADLIGSTVTGAFTLNGSTVNLFDPAIASNTIPAGYQNLHGTAIVIGASPLQFGTDLGCSISCYPVTATFTGTQLDLHMLPAFSFGLLGFPSTFDFTFGDPSFTGISEVSNTFQTQVSGILQTSVPTIRFSGGTISISMAVSAIAGQDYDAVFDLASAPTTARIPEGSGWLGLAAFLTAALTARHRREAR